MAADRGGEPTRAGDAVSELLGGALGRGLSAAASAAKAWYAANGDRERQHTTGVWLRKSGKAGVDPVLVVALDSNLLAMELGTNKDIYLSRLAFRGLAISDIRFTVDHRAPAGSRRAARAKTGSQARGEGAPSLPELSPAERAYVEGKTADLPDGLRQSVSRAMCATMRRFKDTNTRKA